MADRRFIPGVGETPATIDGVAVPPGEVYIGPSKFGPRFAPAEEVAPLSGGVLFGPSGAPQFGGTPQHPVRPRRFPDQPFGLLGEIVMELIGHPTSEAYRFPPPAMTLPRMEDRRAWAWDYIGDGRDFLDLSKEGRE